MQRFKHVTSLRLGDRHKQILELMAGKMQGESGYGQEPEQPALIRRAIELAACQLGIGCFDQHGAFTFSKEYRQQMERKQEADAQFAEDREIAVSLGLARKVRAQKLARRGNK